MQSKKLQPYAQLRGEEAIAALNSYIKVHGTRNKKLTKKQVKTLEKIAKGLISSIKEEQNPN
jgi:hypothetical protein